MPLRFYPWRFYGKVALFSAVVGAAGGVASALFLGFGTMAWVTFAPASAVTWLLAVHTLGRGEWIRSVAVGLVSPFFGGAIIGFAIGLASVSPLDGVLLCWVFVLHWYWQFAPFGVTNGLLMAWLLRPGIYGSDPKSKKGRE